MTDEVGPNDPNRGRSSAGRFKMPFSKPIAVRDVDDVFDAAWGGMRKPKTKEERRSMQVAPDLSGGGYTPAQTNQDRWKIILVFVLVPLAVLAAFAFLGASTDSTQEDPEPLTSSCQFDGYRATYARSDFHENIATVIFQVTLSGDETSSLELVELDLSESSGSEIELIVLARDNMTVERCVVEAINYFR